MELSETNSLLNTSDARETEGVRDYNYKFMADSKQKREALEAAYISVIPNPGTEGVWEKDSQLKTWLKNLSK